MTELTLDKFVEYHKKQRLIILYSALFLIMCVLPCAAQESTRKAEGYLFVAPGLRTHEEAINGITHFGGGGKIFLYKGLAAEAEIGYLRPWQEAYEDLGMLSFDASNTWRKGSKLTRFVFAGFSFGLRDRTLGLHANKPFEDAAETLNLLNFGFGGTYWFRARKGLRFEIRDHLYLAEIDRQYLEFRLAFAFR
jgi:hypothetical protein